MSTLPLTDGITSIGEGKNMDDPTMIIQIGIPDSHRSGHIFVSGSTRSGKSRLAENIIEQDIRKGYNLIVIDPKVDQGLGNKIFQVATAYGRRNDLMYINTMFPEFSLSINPLSHWFILEEIVAHCVAGTYGAAVQRSVQVNLGRCGRCRRLNVLYFPFSETTPIGHQ